MVIAIIIAFLIGIVIGYSLQAQRTREAQENADKWEDMCNVIENKWKNHCDEILKEVQEFKEEKENDN